MPGLESHLHAAGAPARAPARPQVIPSAWLRLFSPKEVNQLLGGGEAAALDVEDMQAHTRYRCGAKVYCLN
jgi:hypothetical protein